MVVVILNSLQVVDKEDVLVEGLLSKVHEAQGAKQSTSLYSRVQSKGSTGTQQCPGQSQV